MTFWIVFHKRLRIRFCRILDRKAKYVLDPKLFKKLEGTDIWEFRTKYDGIQYRLLAFWDTSTNSLVVATHGFIKKVQKTPKQQIKRAEEIRTLYFKMKG